MLSSEQNNPERHGHHQCDTGKTEDDISRTVGAARLNHNLVKDLNK